MRSMRGPKRVVRPLRTATVVAVVAFIALVCMVSATPAAWAGSHLTGSDPVQGARLTAAPARITLTFDQPIDPDLVVIFVTGADGVAWPGGEITAAGNTVTMPVTPSGPQGRCVVRYSVAPAVDTAQPLRGDLAFTLTEPVPASHPPAGASDPQAEPPTRGGAAAAWTWVAWAAGTAALAVVAALAALLVTGGRRPRSQ